MKRVLMPLAAVGLSALAALLIFEVFLRVIGYNAPVWYRPDPQLGWTLRPGVQGWFTKEGRAYVRVNSSGMRDREHLLDKPAGVYRIAVLGDSYSEALQVPLEKTYWAQLPAELARCGFQPGRNIEVLNFGVSGYGTAQQYVMLQSTAMRYQPDLVLLQFTNGNDVRNNSFALEPEKDRPFFMLAAGGELRFDDSFAAGPGFRDRSTLRSEILRKAADRSRVVQLLRAARELPLMGRAHAQGAGGAEAGLETVILAAPRDAMWEEAWRITEALLERTSEYARRNGAQTLVVTVPYAIQVHPDPKQRQALQARLGVDDLFYPDQRVESFARKHGIPALALAPKMQRVSELQNEHFHGFDGQLGSGHWNAAGHRIAAELIAQRLCGG